MPSSLDDSKAHQRSLASQVLLPDKRAGKLKLQAAGIGRPIGELYGSLSKVTHL